MTSRAMNLAAATWAALFFAACVITCGLMGCSATHLILTTQSSPVNYNLTGNWVLTVSPGSGATVPIAIFLTENSGSVSGLAVGPAATDLLVYPDGCVGSPIGPFTNVALTGTVDSEGNLKLATAANAVPSATMTATVSGSSLSNGAFAIKGAASCAPQGSMTGIEYAIVNGTYSGTVTSQATGQSFTVTATLQQSPLPNAEGLLALTGTATVSGYPCIPSGATAISASFVGAGFFTDLSNSPSGTLGWTGSLSPDGKTLGINYGFSPANSACKQDEGTGTLTLQ
ncbi:MAG TPA: hypothetical protein VMT38_12910 [Terracidiphilus sp.]|nr:hypothetical protein [Terracidiphilus sp.]